MNGLLEHSIEDNLTNATQSGLLSLGVDQAMAEKVAPWLAIAPQFIPFVGAGVGVDNTIRALNDGNYKEAAIEAGLTALGEIPILGDLAAAPIRAARGQTGILGMTGKEAAEQARIPEIRRSTEDERLRGKMSPATGEYTKMSPKRQEAMLESSAGRTREEIARANNFETVVEDTFDLNQLPVLTPDDLSGGVFIPLRGDPTLAGNMTQASGVPFKESLELQSGPMYPLKSQIERPDPAAWESTDIVARGYNDKVAKVAKDAGTDNVWGVYDMMDLPSSSFSTMPVEAIIREMETIREAGGKYPQGIIDQIDAAVRAAEVKGKTVFEDFPGILSPDAEAYISRTGFQNARKAVTDRMKMADARDAGFPNVDQVYRDVSVPDLHRNPLGTKGQMLVKLNPNAATDTLSTHRSYGTRIPIAEGENVIGRLGGTIEHELLYPDYHRQMAGQMTAPKSGAAPKPLSRTEIMNTLAVGKPGGARTDGYQSIHDEFIDTLIAMAMIKN